MLTLERKIELLEAFVSEAVAVAQVHEESTGFLAPVSPYRILDAYNRMKMRQFLEDGRC